MILAVVFAKKPEKIQGFNGIWTHDLRVIGALLYQLSYDATHIGSEVNCEFIYSHQSDEMTNNVNEWTIYELQIENVKWRNEPRILVCNLRNCNCALHTSAGRASHW